MRTVKVCHSLLKETYQLGCPFSIVCLCYGIPMILTLIAKGLWPLFIVGLVFHIIFITIYRKDNFFVKDFLSSLREKDYLEP